MARFQMSTACVVSGGCAAALLAVLAGCSAEVASPGASGCSQVTLGVRNVTLSRWTSVFDQPVGTIISSLPAGTVVGVRRAVYCGADGRWYELTGPTGPGWIEYVSRTADR